MTKHKNDDKLFDDKSEQGRDDASPGGKIQSVGPILRQLRHNKGWSLQTLAHESGVSVGMLSQIERDLANPSIRVLTAIRRALDAPMSAIFHEVAPEENKQKDFDFVRRANNRPVLELGTLRKELLTTSGHHNLQIMILHIDPMGSSSKTSFLNYPAEKGGLILSGELLMTVDGKEVLLREGDSFAFDGTLEHSFKNPATTVTQVIWIVGAVQLDRHL